MAPPEWSSAKGLRRRRLRGRPHGGFGHPSATVEEPRCCSPLWRLPRCSSRRTRHRISKLAESPRRIASPCRLPPYTPDCRIPNTTATLRAGAGLLSKAFPHTSVRCAVFCFPAAEPLRNMAFPYKARRATPLRTGPGVPFSYLPPGRLSFRSLVFQVFRFKKQGSGCTVSCPEEVLAYFQE